MSGYATKPMRCWKCGAELVDVRVRVQYFTRGAGQAILPGYVKDARGPLIRTTCANGHYVGNRPADGTKRPRPEF